MALPKPNKGLVVTLPDGGSDPILVDAYDLDPADLGVVASVVVIELLRVMPELKDRTLGSLAELDAPDCETCEKAATCPDAQGDPGPVGDPDRTLH